MNITLLSGGVGGAKLVKGFYNILNKAVFNVICNTGDDLELFGLYICPDLDTVMYTLAGLVDEDRGWGVKNDTFHCLKALSECYGRENWFNIGDRDLATHIYRTELLAKGYSLTEVTRILCRNLGLEKVNLQPMSDDRVRTMVEVESNVYLSFQEYFVKRKCRDPVLNVVYEGVEKAKPGLNVLESIADSDIIIICPSNPIASIGPILAVKGVREKLKTAEGVKVAVTPIIQGAPLKGPADKFMSGVGLEVSAVGVAEYYKGLVDVFILDERDSHLKNRVEELGYTVHVTDTVMNSLSDKIRLSEFILESTGLKAE
ncbi:MAG: 2-phospho-L-lactate transferase [Candidatus Odinarchaeum yellowstonii]|uniref:2-phospho-L-lactate transferase n=1 Tax=Odinarchaeota yellowstonii (strain LCB_4) TaxID=1841599 RepID=A0AAF0D1W1_ODILC|nr:MAG: 2-phospho-L-lactate transferase [Candidatus Odinarchaeum yellowstonii]